MMQHVGQINESQLPQQSVTEKFAAEICYKLQQNEAKNHQLVDVAEYSRWQVWHYESLASKRRPWAMEFVV